MEPQKTKQQSPVFDTTPNQQNHIQLTIEIKPKKKQVSEENNWTLSRRLQPQDNHDKLKLCYVNQLLQ